MSTGSPSKPDGIDFAWRVHDALDSWTGKVDTKASITLGIEIAVFGFVVALSEKTGRFSMLRAADLTLFRVGLALVILSIFLSLAVVLPQLGRKKARRNWKTNMIFFGHLRHWNPTELAMALKSGPLEEDQLARQLVEMSKIAWRKHAWLQWSIVVFAVGAVCLLLAAVV
jgi:Pycsar effector protein